MYSVVAHQNYGREGRRPRAQQSGQQPQEAQESTAEAKEGSRRRHHRHRISLTARLLNYLKRRFNPEPDTRWRNVASVSLAELRPGYMVVESRSSSLAELRPLGGGTSLLTHWLSYGLAKLCWNITSGSLAGLRPGYTVV
ncbi:hypothetical protein J6590_072147 [Homalodisca vitripennis]|nr:hypothetical protein J6590_072147 [Homalodisca vitripennis]